MPKIRKLQDKIIKRHFDYILVERKDRVAIYAQHNKQGRLIAYEVILIKLSPPHFATKSEFDFIELYPSDKQFGITGWSYVVSDDLRIKQALQRARTKFQQL